jgi:hypothetical protein
MRQFTLRILAVTSLATVLIIPAYTQEPLGAIGGVMGGGIGVGGAVAGAMIGPGGMTSSRSDGKTQTFTYSFPKGATVFAVTGAPYAGRMSSQTIRTLANGTHLTQQAFDQPMTYRDTMGRTRTDLEKMRTPDMPGMANIQPQIMRLPEITDPVAGYRIILDPVHQIAHRVAVQARQNQAPNPNAAAARMAANPMPARTSDNGTTTKNENLGTQTIFGVTAIGQRNTTTYPIGTFQGNDQPVTTVNESWRSVQYGLVLRSSNSGVNGDTTTIMKDFSIEEPDPSLFQVPAGYQIVDETGEFTITIPREAQ